MQDDKDEDFFYLKGEQEEDMEEEVKEQEEDVSLKEGPPFKGEFGYKKPTIVYVFNENKALKCLTIKIGSMELKAKPPLLYVPVYLSRNGIILEVPSLNNHKNLHTIFITKEDINYMQVHFEKTVHIVLFATEIFNTLHIIKDYRSFDPTSNDEEEKKITLVMDSITEEQYRYLTTVFYSKNNLQQTTLQPVPAIKFHPEENINCRILIYPPPPQTGGVEITSKDLECLNEGEYLNDAIIDFYLNYILDENVVEREKVHLFSSYFYLRLKQKSGFGQETLQNRHNRIKRWTRHVDIFSKDFIIIPINRNFHWFVAIICFPGIDPNMSSNSDAKEDGENKGNSHTQVENSTNNSNNSLYEVKEPLDSEEPTPEAPNLTTHPNENHGSRRLETPYICIFDSLRGEDRRDIFANLKQYLEMEWLLKKNYQRSFDFVNGYVVQCPQQSNGVDCGLYLLQYVESFFQNPTQLFGNSMPDLSNWFTVQKICKKRQMIKNLILNLQKKQLANCATNAKKPD